MKMILVRIILGGSTTSVADEAKEVKDVFTQQDTVRKSYCFCVLSSLVV